MTEQCRHRAVAAQGGAVDLDETPVELVPAALEFIDAPGEERFAGTGRPHQQHGCPRTHGDPLDLLDGAVESGIARGDSRLEQSQAFLLFAAEPRGDAVVAGQVEVDQRRRALGMARLVLAPRRRGLHQPGRQVARLGKEKPADLRDMGPGGDMHQVVLALGVKGVDADEIVQGAIDLLEVPGVAQFHLLQADLGMRRHRGDVGANPLGQAEVAGVVAVDQFEAVDQQVRLLAQADARPPLLPARRALAETVEGGADEADGDRAFHHCLSFKIKIDIKIYRNSRASLHRIRRRIAIKNLFTFKIK